MDVREFLGLRETPNPHRWNLDVVPGIGTGGLVASGFGHGRVNLWAQDGTLLADASQSCVVRPWRDAKVASLAVVRDQDRRRTRPA